MISNNVNSVYFFPDREIPNLKKRRIEQTHSNNSLQKRRKKDSKIVFEHASYLFWAKVSKEFEVKFNQQWEIIEKNIPHGFDSYTYANGDVYEGSFEHGIRHGEGRYSFKNGEVVEGKFYNGEMPKYGKYTFVNGDQFLGAFGNYFRDFVYGKMFYSNGDKYEGQFQKRERDGYGKYIFFDGTVYEGEFKNNCMNGDGTITFLNGKVCKGNFNEKIWESIARYGDI